MSGQQPYNAYQPPVAGQGRKSGGFGKVVLILLGVFLLMIGGCTAGVVYLSTKAGNNKDEPMKPSVLVTFKITGTSKKVTLTINNGPPGFSSGVSVPPPYETSIKVPPNGHVNMNALNGGSEKGTITCSIIVNKKVVSTKTAKGPAEMASCSYTYIPAK
ncbi:hypothetical protein [Kribbella deserti]|uniref:MmpS family membrane protein n=1 Tax=Kribbella deserti TaxID=1926257 RepID=A0ABV6QQV4_9ACTN